MSKETVIQVENLVKIYRLGKVSIPALRGISFDVAKGEFLVVVGPSGSGKTTLFKLDWSSRQAPQRAKPESEKPKPLST